MFYLVTPPAPFWKSICMEVYQTAHGRRGYARKCVRPEAPSVCGGVLLAVDLAICPGETDWRVKPRPLN